jgi:chromate reductase, NAD(P)H dehydrogenase (quinone)
MRILGICGSLQAKSSNLTLLETAQRCAPPAVEVVLFDGLRHLPHFDPDLDTDAVPAPVEAWRRALAESDGLLIACPEYGHSLPGALKNGIDWAIPSGELEHKVTAMTAAVPAKERGRMGLLALAQTLRAVSAVIVGGEPIARGPSFERDVAALLEALITTVRAPRETFVVS